MTPNGWQVRTLGSVLERVVEPINPEPEVHYREIGIRSHGKGIFHKDALLGKELGDKRVFKVLPDCFVVNIVFAWEQAIARTTSAEEGMIASHRFPMYRPKKGGCDIDFLTYYFKSKKGKYLLELASPGGAGRNKTLGQKEFERLSFPMPSGSEQAKVAKVLTTWDTAIENADKLIANSKAQKKALIQKLLTGTKRLPGFKGAFCKLEFESFASLAKERVAPVNGNSDLRCIELEHLESKTGRLIGSTTVTQQSSLKASFKPGDVLFGKLRPYLQKSWLADSEGYCSTEIWVIRAQQDICLPEFLHLLCQSGRFIAACHVVSGSKMPRAEWSIISKTPFLLPSLEEQLSITKVVGCTSALLIQLIQRRDLLVKEKESLKQQVLTGKRRVAIDAALIRETS
jgi:type I restriction enzyme S subunit